LGSTSATFSTNPTAFQETRSIPTLNQGLGRPIKLAKRAGEEPWTVKMTVDAQLGAQTESPPFWIGRFRFNERTYSGERSRKRSNRFSSAQASEMLMVPTAF
jgi:hypothetical protein